MINDNEKMRPHVKQIVEQMYSYCLKDAVLAESYKNILESAKDEVEEELHDVKSADDVQKFLDNNESKFQTALANIKPQHKSAYKKAWEYLCYAAKKSGSFFVKNWDKILKLIALIALAWICYPWFAAAINFFIAWIKQFNISAGDVLAPGEALQNAAKKAGQSAISDGWAHTINQMNNWD